MKIIISTSTRTIIEIYFVIFFIRIAIIIIKFVYYILEIVIRILLIVLFINKWEIFMATSDYLPTKEGDLVPWTENFVTIANANLALIGLVATDITTLRTKQTDFSTGLNNAIAKQAEAKAATDNKNIKKSALTDNIRMLARQIQAKPGVPDNLKVQLGIKNANIPPSPSVPLIPIDLTLETISGGITRLKWGRGGNSQGTIFVVEASEKPDINFIIIDSTTKTTLDTSFNASAVATYFRVRAKKNDQTSDPSNVVMV